MYEVSRKKAFAAVVLTIVALTAIAYAQDFMNTVTITTTEVVTVSSISDTFPARSAGAKTVNEAITLALTADNGFAEDEDVVVRVELVIDNPNVYAGFRSLVIQILDNEGSVVTTLTKNEPWGEFTLTDITLGDHKYNVKIIYATGEHTLSNVAFKIKATVVAVLP